MKTHPILPGIFLALCTVLSAEPAKLEVHEWGTFTIVSGSDGNPLRWFQPERALAELPSFVQANPFVIAGKVGTFQQGFFVRMETPVIFFYPGKPMPVSVQATMRQGRLTEWFPTPSSVVPSFLRGLASAATGSGDAPVTWEGELHAPGDAAALAQIPPVAGGPGAEYFHAREVPGAWIFHATKIAPGIAPRPPADGKPQAQPWEKFIFYRGAGDALPPYRVGAGPSRAPGEDYLSLEHYGEGGAVEAGFAISVKNGAARWAPIHSRLPATDPNDGSSFAVRTGASLGAPTVPLPQVEKELAAAMTDALTAAGLSADEARAMVATWRDVWFREPGTRILALLPRAWVDSVLPLSITPAPQKITRVFVARFEVFTPSQEKALLALLDEDVKPGAEKVAQFKALQLGRFAQAGLQRVQDLQNRRATERFKALEQASVLQPTIGAR